MAAMLSIDGLVQDLTSVLCFGRLTRKNASLDDPGSILVYATTAASAELELAQYPPVSWMYYIDVKLNSDGKPIIAKKAVHRLFLVIKYRFTARHVDMKVKVSCEEAAQLMLPTETPGLSSPVQASMMQDAFNFTVSDRDYLRLVQTTREFLPKARHFLLEVVHNRNFLDVTNAQALFEDHGNKTQRGVDGAPDLRKLLMSHHVVIIPSENTFVMCRQLRDKQDVKIPTLSSRRASATTTQQPGILRSVISLNFVKCKFVQNIATDGGRVPMIGAKETVLVDLFDDEKTFSSVLLDFTELGLTPHTARMLDIASARGGGGSGKESKIHTTRSMAIPFRSMSPVQPSAHRYIFNVPEGVDVNALGETSGTTAHEDLVLDGILSRLNSRSLKLLDVKTQSAVMPGDYVVDDGTDSSPHAVMLNEIMHSRQTHALGELEKLIWKASDDVIDMLLQNGIVRTLLVHMCGESFVQFAKNKTPAPSTSEPPTTHRSEKKSRGGAACMGLCTYSCHCDENSMASALSFEPTPMQVSIMSCFSRLLQTSSAHIQFSRDVFDHLEHHKLCVGTLYALQTFVTYHVGVARAVQADHGFSFLAAVQMETCQDILTPQWREFVSMPSSLLLNVKKGVWRQSKASRHPTSWEDLVPQTQRARPPVSAAKVEQVLSREQRRALSANGPSSIDSEETAQNVLHTLGSVAGRTFIASQFSSLLQHKKMKEAEFELQRMLSPRSSTITRQISDHKKFTSVRAVAKITEQFPTVMSNRKFLAAYRCQVFVLKTLSALHCVEESVGNLRKLSNILLQQVLFIGQSADMQEKALVFEPFRVLCLHVLRTEHAYASSVSLWRAQGLQTLAYPFVWFPSGKSLPATQPQATTDADGKHGSNVSSSLLEYVPVSRTNNFSVSVENWSFALGVNNDVSQAAPVVVDVGDTLAFQKPTTAVSIESLFKKDQFLYRVISHIQMALPKLAHLLDAPGGKEYVAALSSVLKHLKSTLAVLFDYVELHPAALLPNITCAVVPVLTGLLRFFTVTVCASLQEKVRTVEASKVAACLNDYCIVCATALNILSVLMRTAQSEVLDKLLVLVMAADQNGVSNMMTFVLDFVQDCCVDGKQTAFLRAHLTADALTRFQLAFIASIEGMCLLSKRAEQVSDTPLVFVDKKKATRSHTVSTKGFWSAVEGCFSSTGGAIITGLQQERLSNGVQLGLVHLVEIALTSCPRNSPLCTAGVVAPVIELHFSLFTKLYLSLSYGSSDALDLCSAHMNTLLRLGDLTSSLVCDDAARIASHFHQLKVVDFIVQELSLEHQLKTQPVDSSSTRTTARMHFSDTARQLASGHQTARGSFHANEPDELYTDEPRPPIVIGDKDDNVDLDSNDDDDNFEPSKSTITEGDEKDFSDEDDEDDAGWMGAVDDDDATLNPVSFQLNLGIDRKGDATGLSLKPLGLPNANESKTELALGGDAGLAKLDLNSLNSKRTVLPSLSLPTNLPPLDSSYMSESTTPLNKSMAATSRRVSIANNMVSAKRLLHPLYKDKHLHVTMLRLLLRLLLDPSQKVLSGYYCDRNMIGSEVKEKKQDINVFFVLSYHLNNQLNDTVTFELCDFELPNRARGRLLRLVMTSLFDASQYLHIKRVGRGRYAQVFESTSPFSLETRLAVKKIDVPGSVHEYNAFADVFTEVSILEDFRYHAHITHLLDFGVGGGFFWIVTPLVAYNLREWRLKAAKDDIAKLYGSRAELSTTLTLPVKMTREIIEAPDTHGFGLGVSSDDDSDVEEAKYSNAVWMREIKVYIRIFRQILLAVQALHAKGVTHFDLKCDNVLLQVDLHETAWVDAIDPGMTPSNMAMLSNATPEKRQSGINEAVQHLGASKKPFSCVLVDFGESTTGHSSFAQDARGTENIQSPEIIQWSAEAESSGVAPPDYKSDVWSLGCLFFEICTGSFLFEEMKELPVFFQITRQAPLITEKNQTALRNNEHLLNFLEFVLVRDRDLRPELGAVIDKLDETYSKLFQQEVATQPSALMEEIEGEEVTVMHVEAVGNLGEGVTNVEVDKFVPQPPVAQVALESKETKASVDEVPRSCADVVIRPPDMLGLGDTLLNRIRAVKGVGRVGVLFNRLLIVEGSGASASVFGVQWSEFVHMGLSQLVYCGEKIDPVVEKQLKLLATIGVSSSSFAPPPPIKSPQKGRMSPQATPSPPRRSKSVASAEGRDGLGGNVDFVKRALSFNQPVVLFSTCGSSRFSVTVAVAYIMECYGLSYFEALTHVLTIWQRVGTPDFTLTDLVLKFVRMQQSIPVHFYPHRQNDHTIERIRCLCGACVIVVDCTLNEEQNKGQHVRCECNPGDTNAVCPSGASCGVALQRFSSLYGETAVKTLNWLSVSAMSFLDERSRVDVVRSSVKMDMQRSDKSQLYECRVCMFPLLAVRPEKDEGATIAQPPMMIKSNVNRSLNTPLTSAQGGRAPFSQMFSKSQSPGISGGKFSKFFAASPVNYYSLAQDFSVVSNFSMNDRDSTLNQALAKFDKRPRAFLSMFDY